MFVPDVFVPR